MGKMKMEKMCKNCQFFRERSLDPQEGMCWKEIKDENGKILYVKWLNTFADKSCDRFKKREK